MEHIASIEALSTSSDLLVNALMASLTLVTDASTIGWGAIVNVPY